MFHKGVHLLACYFDTVAVSRLWDSAKWKTLIGPDYSREVVSILSWTVSDGKARKRLAVASETVSIGTTWRKPLTGGPRYGATSVSGERRSCFQERVCTSNCSE